MEKNTVNLSLTEYHNLKDLPDQYRKKIKELQKLYEDLKDDKVVVAINYCNEYKRTKYLIKEDHIINIMQKTIDDLRVDLERQKLLNKRSWWKKVFK